MTPAMNIAAKISTSAEFSHVESPLIFRICTEYERLRSGKDMPCNQQSMKHIVERFSQIKLEAENGIRAMQEFGVDPFINDCRAAFNEYCIKADFGKGESVNYVEEWPTFWKIWQTAYTYSPSAILDGIATEICKIAIGDGVGALNHVEKVKQYLKGKL